MRHRTVFLAIVSLAGGAGCHNHNSSHRSAHTDKSSKYVVKSVVDKPKAGSTYFDHEDFDVRQPSDVTESRLPRESVDVYPLGNGAAQDVANKVDGSAGIEHATPKEVIEKKVAPDKSH